MDFDKKRMLSINTLVLACLIGTASCLGSEEAPPTSDAKNQAIKTRRSVMQEFAKISRQLNQKPEIMALRKKMQAAQKAYQEALESAIAKENPELLNQYKAVREALRERVLPPHTKVDMGQVEKSSNGYGQFSAGERARLDAARRAAMETPVVKEARKERNEAKNEEERVSAVKKYRKVLYNAMIEADKEVEGLLKKLERKDD